MALQTIRIGSAENVFQYDDAAFDSAIETAAPIKSGTPAAADDVLRLGDLAATVLSAAFPVGAVYLSVVATNPNVLLGFGTWVRIAEGQFLVGFKTADADFDPVENTGGTKTHDHPSTTSGAPSANTLVDNNADGTTISVATGMATHDTDLPAISHLPPFFVIYVWKRTV